MNRILSLGVILTILLALLLARCHYSNQTTTTLMTSYEATSNIAFFRSQINQYYYSYEELPNSNADLRQPAPEEFARKSTLLQRIEVMPGGKLLVQFTDHDNQPSQVIYTPILDGYRLTWSCSAFNLPQNLRQALPELCLESTAAYDRDAVVQQQEEKQEQQQETQSYIEQISSAQREKAEPVQSVDCSAVQSGSDDFLQISADTVEYWSLAEAPRKLYEFARPALGHETAHWATAGQAYLYVDNRLQVYDAEHPEGIATQVNLMSPSRFRRSENLLMANSGIGLSRINLCPPAPVVKDNYLLQLGAFSQIQDFILRDNLVFLTALEANRPRTYSALQVVSMRSNRAVGFLKLEGSSGGIVLQERIAYIANGSRGITLVDVFDPSLPRLLKQVAVRDFASDVALFDGYLVVADRLAGLKVFKPEAESLALIQEIPTPEAAIQIKPLARNYFAVAFKNGTSRLFQWHNYKVESVALSSH